jgi:hypothetical protein
MDVLIRGVLCSLDKEPITLARSDEPCVLAQKPIARTICMWGEP